MKREEPDTYRLLRKATQSAARITAKTTKNTSASCPFSTGEYFPSAVDPMTVPLTGTAATDTSHSYSPASSERCRRRRAPRRPPRGRSTTSRAAAARTHYLTLQDYERLRRATLTIIHSTTSTMIATITQVGTPPSLCRPRCRLFPPPWSASSTNGDWLSWSRQRHHSGHGGVDAGHPDGPGVIGRAQSNAKHRVRNGSSEDR